MFYDKKVLTNIKSCDILTSSNAFGLLLYKSHTGLILGGIKMKKGFNITLSVLSKIAEVVLWIGAVCGIVGAVGCVVDTQGARKLVHEIGELENTAFSMDVLSNTGEVNTFALSTFFVGTVITMVLTALIFRNIYNILSAIAGRNKHTKSTSPFQKDIVRMVKEIGIFSISIPVVGIIISTIVMAVSLINSYEVEVSVSLNSIFIGLICFSLVQIFTYGAKLEEEVDGLV